MTPPFISLALIEEDGQMKTLMPVKITIHYTSALVHLNRYSKFIIQ